MSPVTVLVDARNVLRSVWPNIAEARLVELCAAWAEREGVEAVVVFDGRAPAGPAGVNVVETGAESADEWIERAAGELAARPAPYWLVTSDRALRASVGRAADRTIGGGTFARSLLALDRA